MLLSHNNEPTQGTRTMNEITTTDNNAIVAEIQGNNKICQALMQSPHYKRMGPEGVMAIVEKAKSMGVSILDALNGGMFYVQGKVEMTSSMMNQQIRMHKHSITKDKRSDDTICILHGKRSDTGDTWVESFSIADAQRAGIYKNQWLKYPKDMLFARALSRLARQLFPDVIKGCYVQGEIQSETPKNITHNIEIDGEVMRAEEFSECVEMVSPEQYIQLEEAIGEDILLRQNVLTFIKRKWGKTTLQELPLEIFDHVLSRASKNKRATELEVVEDVAS